jgi:hypothetical protein
MISRIAPYLIGAVSALALTASFAVAQTAPTPPAPSAPPAATSPGSGAGVGSGSGSGAEMAPGRRGGRERTEGRAAMGACRTDMQTLCGTVERGKGKKLACLIENRAKASPECQTAITAVEAARTGKAADRAAKRAEGGAKGGKGGGKMAACCAPTSNAAVAAKSPACGQMKPS